LVKTSKIAGGMYRICGADHMRDCVVGGLTPKLFFWFNALVRTFHNEK
jgi:hypothetical protein